MSLADRWRRDLAGWAIPPDILAQAPESPWIHPVGLFVAADAIPDSQSHARAREAVPDAGSVLDVGCGGGRAAFALVPPAAEVIGVDHQAGMLARFAEAAEQRGVRHVEVLGDWPDVAPLASPADVAVCHHVAYNVADIVPFLAALDDRARRRVVLEVPARHPLAAMGPLWQRFWHLDRPGSPTADDLLAVAREVGYDARIEHWQGAVDAGRAPVDDAEQVRFMRIRLCLPPERDPEVAAALAAAGPPPPRELATIWWDSSPRGQLA